MKVEEVSTILSTILSIGSDAIGKDDMECVVYKLLQLKEVLSATEFTYLMLAIINPDTEKLDIIHEFFKKEVVDSVDMVVL